MSETNLMLVVEWTQHEIGHNPEETDQSLRAMEQSGLRFAVDYVSPRGMIANIKLSQERGEQPFITPFLLDCQTGKICGVGEIEKYCVAQKH